MDVITIKAEAKLLNLAVFEYTQMRFHSRETGGQNTEQNSFFHGTQKKKSQMDLEQNED